MNNIYEVHQSKALELLNSVKKKESHVDVGFKHRLNAADVTEKKI